MIPHRLPVVVIDTPEARLVIHANHISDSLVRLQESFREMDHQFIHRFQAGRSGNYKVFAVTERVNT